MLLTNEGRADQAKQELMDRMSRTYKDLCESYGVMAAWAYMEKLYSEFDLVEWQTSSKVQTINE